MAELERPAPFPDSEVLDLEQIEEIRAMPGRTSGSLLTEFVALFLRDEPARLAELTRLVAERQYAEIAREAHMLAGSCSILGAKEMQRAALELQAASRASPGRDLAPLLVRLRETGVRLRAVLGRRGLLPK